MSPPSQEIRFARLASGARLAWACSGHGPVLLRAAHWMTHVGQDAASPIWRPWLERLGRSLQILRYDERGCGASGPDDTPPGLESAVEELEVVADAAGAARLAVLGMSSGAAPAVVYAARHPDRVSHLVLLGGFAAGTLARGATPEQQAYHEATAQLVALGWGRAGAPVQQFFTASMIPDAEPAQREAMNEQQRLCCDATRAAALVQARARLDARPWLSQVRCPTLVLHCEHDATVSLELGRELAAGIPGARFQVLPGRNHVPLAGQPAFEQFCDATAALVRERPQQGPLPELTERQREMLHLVARGLDNLQIGAQLGLADKTVRNALSRLYAVLEVEGRPQAVVKARDLGFG